MPKLAIIILSFNTKHLTLNCLKSIFDDLPAVSYEVIVVDNGSTDGSVDEIKKQYKKVRVLENSENLGFSKGNNIGIKSIKADYYLLLNSDTVISKNSLGNLISFADMHPEFGIIGPKLLNTDKSFQPNAGELPNPLNTFLWVSDLDSLFPSLSYQARDKSYYKDSKQVGWVSGAVMLIKSDVVEKIKGLDEDIFMYCEDVEFCYRARRSGFKVGWTDSVEIIHIGGASSTEPKFRQWLGEFKGMLYIYSKYYGGLVSGLMKLQFYIFILIRAVIFTALGNFSFGRTYAKVAINL